MTVTGSPGAGGAGGLPGVGQTAQRGNWAVTLEKVERADRVGASTAAPQGKFLIVYLTLKNVGRQSYPLNSFDFSVTTAGNKKYNTASAGAGQKLDDHEVILFGQTVQPDLSSKNAVVFDIPPDARDLTLDVQGIKFAIPNS